MRGIAWVYLLENLKKCLVMPHLEIASFCLYQVVGFCKAEKPAEKFEVMRQLERAARTARTVPIIWEGANLFCLILRGVAAWQFHHLSGYKPE